MLTGYRGRTYGKSMAARPRASSGFPRPPRDLALACGTGLGLGGLAAGTAFVSYIRAGGPTWSGVGVIPFSVLLVGVLYLRLLRRRKLRASDWLALGYTASIILATGLLTLWEAFREFYAGIAPTTW
jgi:hypothetical protein